MLAGTPTLEVWTSVIMEWLKLRKYDVEAILNDMTSIPCWNS
jgi:hypothetical protein